LFILVKGELNPRTDYFFLVILWGFGASFSSLKTETNTNGEAGLSWFPPIVRELVGKHGLREKSKNLPKIRPRVRFLRPGFVRSQVSQPVGYLIISIFKKKRA